MAVFKRILSSGATQALLRPLTRAYRAIFFAGVHVRHDRSLLTLLRSREPALFAVWHQDFFWTCGYLSRWNGRRPTQVLASASRDGALMAAAAQAVGFRGAVRGSTARGGAQALRGLARLAAGGGDSILVVCDGPRPPARVLQPGVLHVARESGLPIWLLRTSWRPAKVLERSWARFVVPWPLGRGVALADGPIRVAPDLDREGLENLRVVLEARLNDLAERADRLVASG
jgi:lysophospholipid acyltransferase (LPLAT)-like uncharacterized protein